MTFTVSFWLYPKFELQRAYMAYPAMTAVYVSLILLTNISYSQILIFSLLFFSLQYIGFIVGLVHAIDSYTAYKCYKGYG